MRKIVDVAPFAAVENRFVGKLAPEAPKSSQGVPAAATTAALSARVALSPPSAATAIVALRRTSALALFAAVCALPTAVFAQGTPPSRPTDIDPAVNTSSPEQTPARETPRPQDINPGVDTSSPSQTRPASSSSTPARSSTSPSTSAPSAAAPANAAGSASSPAAPAARSTTATKPAGSATAPGTASSNAASSTPSTPGKGKGKALDRLELDATQITGNRELPKVLYIVPWKRSDLGDLVGKPVNSLLDEVLTPVDRDVFKRENRYYRALTPAQNADQGGNTTAPPAGTPAPASTSSGSAAPASRDER